MLMENSPSSCNWMAVMKLKRPNLHRVSCLQAVAHGGDTVQYFQWRASRGGYEKFHGAVVMHDGTENTRVFRDVAEVGELLKKLDPVIGTTVRPEVAIVMDWENRWAIEAACGPRREGREYPHTCALDYPASGAGLSVEQRSTAARAFPADQRPNGSESVAGLIRSARSSVPPISRAISPPSSPSCSRRSARPWTRRSSSRPAAHRQVRR
jgi:hypothetical protein